MMNISDQDIKKIKLFLAKRKIKMIISKYENIIKNCNYILHGVKPVENPFNFLTEFEDWLTFTKLKVEIESLN